MSEKHILSRTFAYVKAYYQHILSAVLIIVLILVVYWRDLEILVNEALQSEALSHVLLIPFFAGFLFYLKKDMLRASLTLDKHQKKTKTQYVDELVGMALCLIAFLIYWYGSYTFYPLQYHLLSLPIFVTGITLILFNLKALTILIFPILFLLFLTPLPAEFMYTAGGTLANVNTQAAYTLLRAFGLPVTLSSSYGPPTILFTTSAGQSALFAVDLPCSGVYSLIAFAMFATFLALITSASVFRKALVFVLGFFVFEIMNIIRITAIISVGYWFGEDVAMLMFHAITGLVLIFVGMLLTLFVAEKFLKIQILPTPHELSQCPKCRINQKNFENFCSNCGRFLGQFHAKVSEKFWIKIFLLLLGCSVIVFSIHAPTFAVAQGPIEVAPNSGWQNATNVFPEIAGYSLRFLYRDTNYEKIARQDASLMYAYFPINDSHSLVYVDVGVASSISNLHSWEVCLITWQTAQGGYPLVTVLDSRDIQLSDAPIIARYLVFKSPESYTQVTLYWYEKVTFKTGITVEPKYVRISLVILTQNSTNYPLLEDELSPIGQAIASHWEPLKTQSLISIAVPIQQMLLIFTITFVVFTKAVQYSNEWRKKTNNLKIFDKFASSEEKFVLQTVLSLVKEKKKVTTREICSAVEEAMRKPVKHSGLLSILNRLEGYGFIKRDVVFRNEPVLIWKI